MDVMEAMGIDGDQDWERETTRYVVDGELVVVSGPHVRLPTQWEGVASIAIAAPFEAQRGEIHVGDTDDDRTHAPSHAPAIALIADQRAPREARPAPDTDGRQGEPPGPTVLQILFPPLTGRRCSHDA